jgi:beta-mannosidase
LEDGIKKINLNENWALKEAPLNFKKDMAGFINNEPGWFEGYNLPLDVHIPLIDHNVIKEPTMADYSASCLWIENRSWWFRKTFDGAELDPDALVYRLVLESLDSHADIFFNGAYLGHHASAHYPFIYDVAGLLRSGENVLLIRLTSGLEYINDETQSELDFHVVTEAGRSAYSRGDKRRAFVRKPTYVYGWDWCPRIATVAIAKNVYIECLYDVSIEGISVETAEPGSTAKLNIVLDIEMLDPVATADADIDVVIRLDGEIKCSAKICDSLLLSGTNYIELEMSVPDAKIWWPAGMGEQPLYTISAIVSCRDRVVVFPEMNFGIRTITLNTERMNEQCRKFELIVNGIPIFCKGANWIPADSIYARVTPEKYDTLVKEAVEANFNMLRVWGGGLYECDAFYDACDKYGILVWQDMMFGCSAYPDHLQDFWDLVGREFDYQTKRLRDRACLALFCGNNENHTIFRDKVEKQRVKQYGFKMCNVLMPEYIRKNCKWIIYWNSSPYGGDYPQSPYVGDVHHWKACMMNPEMSMRIEPKEFDKIESRFVSEYGYPGPCAKDSIIKYFDGHELVKGGDIWNHHNNTYEKMTVDAGIRKHFTNKDLDLDEYLLYAGLGQSLMLEYSLESLRAKLFCAGALFWMYNDCWGEVGWTIIDYYETRKISFYGTKRAFAPVKLIMREHNADKIAVIGINDTPDTVSFRLKYGYVTFDGSQDDSREADVMLKPYSRFEVLSFKMRSHDALNGIFYAKPVDGCVRPAIFRTGDARTLNLCSPKVRINNVVNEGNDLVMEIASDTYSYGVYIDAPLSLRMSDNYFEMLPGDMHKVRIQDGAGKSFRLRTAEIVKHDGED